MKLVQLSVPPEDAQFLQTHQMSDRKICAMYGVPPHMVGDLDKAIKSNVEQQNIELLQFTISPILTTWRQELQRKLFATTGRSAGRYSVGFDTRDLLRPDSTSRQAYYQSGIQNGYLLQNEVREMEGHNPYEDGIGSEPAIQLNMQPLANMLGPQQDGNDGGTIEEQNSLVSRLSDLYLPLFRDGLSRFIHRSKRDLAGVLACIGPCLETISVSFRGAETPATESLNEIARMSNSLFEQYKSATDDLQDDLALRRTLINCICSLMGASSRDISAARAAQSRNKEQHEEQDQ
jgi:hypothetical protein